MRCSQLISTSIKIEFVILQHPFTRLVGLGSVSAGHGIFLAETFTDRPSKERQHKGSGGCGGGWMLVGSLTNDAGDVGALNGADWHVVQGSKGFVQIAAHFPERVFAELTFAGL